MQAASYRALGPQASAGSAPPRHVVLADHAGSGKTLAYLLPLLQLLKGEEAVLGRAATQPSCPRLVVAVPTAELAAQVLRVLRALCRGPSGLRLRCGAFTGGRPLRTQREALEGGVDVAVGTPGRLAELLAEGVLRLDFCRAVVCDEVDVLLGGCGGSARGRGVPVTVPLASTASLLGAWRSASCGFAACRSCLPRQRR